jgi:ABC-type uncharacterized transport system substrate-binding protein
MTPRRGRCSARANSGAYVIVRLIAAEFVRRKVDTLSGTAIATAKQETSTIPIVFAVAVDPERN